MQPAIKKVPMGRMTKEFEEEKWLSKVRVNIYWRKRPEQDPGMCRIEKPFNEMIMFLGDVWRRMSKEINAKAFNSHIKKVEVRRKRIENAEATVFDIKEILKTARSVSTNVSCRKISFVWNNDLRRRGPVKALKATRKICNQLRNRYQ